MEVGSLAKHMNVKWAPWKWKFSIILPSYFHSNHCFSLLMFKATFLHPPTQQPLPPLPPSGLALPRRRCLTPGLTPPHRRYHLSFNNIFLTYVSNLNIYLCIPSPTKLPLAHHTNIRPLSTFLSTSGTAEISQSAAGGSLVRGSRTTMRSERHTG